MYKPEECPYGDCDSHCCLEVGGRVYDCEVCQQVYILIENAEKNKEQS